MLINEYAALDATALADLIAIGEVTPAEVHHAAAAAVDQVNGDLNALAAPRFDEVLEHDATGPFGGVPFLIKDLITHAAGVPQKAGTRLLGDGAAMPEDNTLMTRFRAAGFATMGVTTTPELGFNAATEALAYGGPTRNPWDLTRSPGGSSGGSAALVAAGAVPVAHANDGGGSIRIPAAACGLVGLKPSRGRTPTGPDYADPLLGMGVEFVVTRTVRDAARCLDAVAGEECGGKYLFPDSGTYGAIAQQGSRSLRVGYTTVPYDATRSVNPQSVRAVEQMVAKLEQLGHHVEQAAPVVDAESFDRNNLNAWCSFLADGVAGLAAATGAVPGPDTLEATTLACVEHGMTLTALDMYDIEREMNATRRSVGQYFERYDVLVTPTTAEPTVAIGHLNADDPTLDARGWYSKIFEYGAFTALFNSTGNPAVSLPLAMSDEGWPIGIQFVGRYGDEATLLALAGDLEREVGWSDRRPTVFVH